MTIKNIISSRSNSTAIIGSGFIAKSFFNCLKNTNIVIFVSGVSNSKCKNKYEYKREFLKLKKIKKKVSDKKIIYFSTCSILDQTRNKNM